MTNTNNPGFTVQQQGTQWAELGIHMDRLLTTIDGTSAVTEETAGEVRSTLIAARDACDLMAGAHARELRAMRTG